jgi:amidase
MRFLRGLEWRSTYHTYLAQKLRATGFVFLSKTNVPELAASPITDSAAFGPARNRFDLARTAGGSRGGSAAAVAAGMVAVAHGNDGTGSIRIPASCCGLAGLKPSRGCISHGLGRSGGFLGDVCEPVLTRSVRDSAAILVVIAGPMPGDLFVASPPRAPYHEALGCDRGQLRIGLVMHDPLLEGLKAVQPAIPADRCIGVLKGCRSVSGSWEIMGVKTCCSELPLSLRQHDPGQTIIPECKSGKIRRQDAL